MKHLIALRRESVPSEALIHRFVLLKLQLRQLLILRPLYELVSELLQDHSFMRLHLRDRLAGRGLPVQLALDGVEDLPGASGRLLLELLRLVEDDRGLGLAVHVLAAQNLLPRSLLDRQSKHLRLAVLVL